MAELVDLDVREISLVDRPATGRRFRIYKAEEEGGLMAAIRRALGGSKADGLADVREALQPIAATVENAVARIEQLESAAPVRQSAVVEPQLGGRGGMWRGVL
jgi:hypothetical protein